MKSSHVVAHQLMLKAVACNYYVFATIETQFDPFHFYISPAGPKSAGCSPHLVKQLLQLLLQLGKVAGSNQAFLGLVQAVSNQLDQLVLDESQHPVSQREGAVWRAVGDNLKQALLHLGCGLQGGQAHKDTVSNYDFYSTQHQMSKIFLWVGSYGFLVHTFGKRSL